MRDLWKGKERAGYFRNRIPLYSTYYQFYTCPRPANIVTAQDPANESSPRCVSSVPTLAKAVVRESNSQAKRAATSCAWKAKSKV